MTTVDSSYHDRRISGVAQQVLDAICQEDLDDSKSHQQVSLTAPGALHIGFNSNRK